MEVARCAMPWAQKENAGGSCPGVLLISIIAVMAGQRVKAGKNRHVRRL
jgi:hypothetical protein